MKSRKYLCIKEFLESGLLLEANRQFFHPLGLALEVGMFEDGTCSLSGIWDSRDDSEEILFSDPIGPEGSEYVENLRAKHASARKKMIKGGTTIQPIGLGIAISED